MRDERGAACAILDTSFDSCIMVRRNNLERERLSFAFDPYVTERSLRLLDLWEKLAGQECEGRADADLKLGLKLAVREEANVEIQVEMERRAVLLHATVSTRSKLVTGCGFELAYILHLSLNLAAITLISTFYYLHFLYADFQIHCRRLGATAPVT